MKFNPFKHSATLLALSAVLFHACDKHDLPSQTRNTRVRTEVENEVAFKDIPGKLVYLKDKSGNVKVTLLQKKDKYVLDGDIVLSAEQVKQLESNINRSDSGARTGVSNMAKFWPGRTVYYMMNANLPNKYRVTDAIAHWQSRTNIQFVQRTNQANYIEFIEDESCYSNSVGMMGGRQIISLGPECTVGNAIHEIGHAVGFYHEQTREDRDKYIIVNRGNINPNFVFQFDKYSKSQLPGFQIGTLDIGSVMMYGSYDFSINGNPTITRLDGSTFQSQRIGLSAADVETFDYMYNRPFFANHRYNFQYNNGSDYYEYIYDSEITAFSDQALTNQITLSKPWKVRYKKTTTWSNTNTVLVDYYEITLPVGTRSMRMGQDIYRVEYISGVNYTYEEYWQIDTYVPSDNP